MNFLSVIKLSFDFVLMFKYLQIKKKNNLYSLFFLLLLYRTDNHSAHSKGNNAYKKTHHKTYNFRIKCGIYKRSIQLISIMLHVNNFFLPLSNYGQFLIKCSTCFICG